MKTAIKIILPVLILILAVGIFRWQMNNKPVPKKKQKPKIVPVVQFEQAKSVADHKYTVTGYGTVQPAKKVAMVSEVAGKVIWVSDKLITGGVFKKGEAMYRVDDESYRSALNARIASLTNAEMELTKIEEQAAISLKEWEIWNSVGEGKKAGALVSYEPQLKAAKATVESAKSAVVSAKSDLAKVLYKAPFDCVVTEETIEFGKVIRVGESAGTLVGSSAYEVYVPVSAGYVKKLSFSMNPQMASTGHVELVEGAESFKWDVTAGRVLPDADSKTGMLRAVLIVKDPLTSNPMLPIGANVRAVIKEKDSSEVIRIPVGALREGNVVWVLAQGKLQIRDVEVAEKRAGFAYISAGLGGDEKIITSDLGGVLDGMTVNTGRKKGMGKGMGKGKGGGAQ